MELRTTASCGPAAVGQIVDSNGSGGIDDGDLPVAVLYQDGHVAAVWGDGSGTAWVTTDDNYGQDGGLSIGDVTGDGWPDVITASALQVCALDGNTGAQHWCSTGLYGKIDTLGYNYPSVADLDGDGNAEVIVGATILSGGTGAVIGQGSLGIGAGIYDGSGTSTYGAISAAVDLDNDGQLEVVTGNAAYDISGGLVWSNNGLDGLVAVADFDGDGDGEIVKTSGIYVTGMETDGTEVWGPLTYSGHLGAPAVDDLDGDGTPDIVFAAQNSLVAMAWGGEVMWTASIRDSSGAAGPTLFDFEMDGYPEVLYADEASIQFFSGLDGSVKFASDQHASYTILETPIVADIDGDDQVEIILGHCTTSSHRGSFGSITVYGDADESWPPGRKIWNQHAYQITNVDSDGNASTGTGNNFATYNSFRSGDVGLPPDEYRDLRAEVLDVCEDECEQGTAHVQARISNAGNIEVPAGVPVSLRAGAGGPILTVERTSSPVPPGSTGETLAFVVSAADLSGAQPVITADEDLSGTETLYDCDESNNAAAWSDPVCP